MVLIGVTIPCGLGGGNFKFGGGGGGGGGEVPPLKALEKTLKNACPDYTIHIQSLSGYCFDIAYSYSSKLLWELCNK